MNSFIIFLFATVMVLFITISINTVFASLPLSDCITYNQLLKTIFLKCASANFNDIYNQINNNNILSRQSATDKIWLLNAGLTIQKGSTFYINSTDTNWLKIAIDGINLNEIHVLGSLKVDSVKITSWDTTTNDYGKTNGSRQTVQDKLVLNKGITRPYIKVETQATGTTDIANSEIAYLGFEGGTNTGASGLVILVLITVY